MISTSTIRTDRIFDAVSLDEIACHHARHTSQFAPIPRRKATANGRSIFLVAFAMTYAFTGSFAVHWPWNAMKYLRKLHGERVG